MIGQSLIFDIDAAELEAWQRQLAATPKELTDAYNRAISRTAVTLKKRATILIRDDLGVKSNKAIRERIQSFRIKGEGNLSELKLWFGLNDIVIGKLNGRTTRIGSKRQPKGVRFSSNAFGVIEFDDSFIAKEYGRRSIWARRGAERLPLLEQKVPVSDALHIELENDVFAELTNVFMNHFVTDLRGRVAMRTAS